MTIENARALQEQLANEAIAQLRKNGNNELVDDCIRSIAVVGKAFLGRALAGTVKAVEARAADDDEPTPS